MIVMGVSAGRLKVLREILPMIPRDFRHPIVIVSHEAKGVVSKLPEILNQHADITVQRIESGEELLPGRVYTSRGGQDVVFQEERAELVPPCDDFYFSPSINRTLQSAALAFGEKLIAVILTGRLDDGVAALDDVTRLGGTTIVQDPRDAEYPSMPLQAIQRARPSFVLPAAEIASKLIQLGQNGS